MLVLLNYVKTSTSKVLRNCERMVWNMEKLYRKYAIKLYPMILVVNLYRYGEITWPPKIQTHFLSHLIIKLLSFCIHLKALFM